jgi:hypothetical protein
MCDAHSSEIKSSSSRVRHHSLPLISVSLRLSSGRSSSLARKEGGSSLAPASSMAREPRIGIKQLWYSRYGTSLKLPGHYALRAMDDRLHQPGAERGYPLGEYPFVFLTPHACVIAPRGSAPAWHVAVSKPEQEPFGCADQPGATSANGTQQRFLPDAPQVHVRVCRVCAACA